MSSRLFSIRLWSLSLLWNNPYALLNAKVLLEFDTKKKIWAPEIVRFVNCLLCKHKDLSLSSRIYIKAKHGSACLLSWVWGFRDRMITGACFPTHLAQVARSMFSENMEWLKIHLTLSSVLYTQLHTHIHTTHKCFWAVLWAVEALLCILWSLTIAHVLSCRNAQYTKPDKSSFSSISFFKVMLWHSGIIFFF